MKEKLLDIYTDDWFAFKETVKLIQYDLSKYFIFGIKFNRTVAFLKESKLQGYFKGIESLDMQDNSTLTVWVKDS